MDESQEFEQMFQKAAAELGGSTPAQEAAPADTGGKEPAESPAPAPAAGQPEEPSAATPAAQPAKAPAEQAAAPEAKPPSIEELLRRISDLESKERASASRASQTARENNRLQDQLRQLQERLTSAPAPTPSAPEADDPLASAPDLAASIERRIKQAIDPLAQKVDKTAEVVGKVNEVVVPIEEQAHKKAIAETHAELDDKFGKAWRATVASPQYDEWLQSQPQWVRDLATKAVGFEDSATVLGRYYAKHGFPTREPAPPPPDPAPSAPAAGKDPQARLRAAAGISTQSQARPANKPSDDDFEGNFAQAMAELSRAQPAQRM